jgi:hypothetical protein
MCRVRPPLDGSQPAVDGSRQHGGDRQAEACAREDLDGWAAEWAGGVREI